MEIAPALPPSTSSVAPPDRDSGRADDPLLALFAGLLVQAATPGMAPPSGAPAQTSANGAVPQQAPAAQALGAVCQPPAPAGPDMPQACLAPGGEGPLPPAQFTAGVQRLTGPPVRSMPNEAAPPAAPVRDGGRAPSVQPEALPGAAARTGVSTESRPAKVAVAEPPASADARVVPRKGPSSAADEGKFEKPLASSAPDSAARSGSSGAGDPVDARGDIQAVPDQQLGQWSAEANASPRAETAAAGSSRHELPAASGSSPAVAPEHPAPVVLAAPDPQGRQVTARLMVADRGDGRRLRIELSPAELGRVEVSLRLDDQGNAAAIFTVDRPETLQLLQRDARAVTELLATAGFSVDQGGLGFLLRGGAGDMGRPDQQPQAGPGPQPRRPQATDGDHPTPPAAWSSRGLLDLHV